MNEVNGLGMTWAEWFARAEELDTANPFTDWNAISKTTEEKKAANPKVPWHVLFNKRMGFTK